MEDFREGSQWVTLAKTHWLGETANVQRVKLDTIKKELWDPLQADGFKLRSLLTLENLNVLEKCVHPSVFRLKIPNIFSGFFGPRIQKILPTTMCY